jgi:hypothetical protein
MTFSLLAQQIKVFYKHCLGPLELAGFSEPKITYYRQYLPKQEEVIFTFTEKDQVEKLGGK